MQPISKLYIIFATVKNTDMKEQVYTVTVLRTNGSAIYTQVYRSQDNALNAAKDFRAKGYVTFTDTTTLRD